MGLKSENLHLLPDSNTFNQLGRMQSGVQSNSGCVFLEIGFISVCLISTSDDLNLFKNKPIQICTHMLKMKEIQKSFLFLNFQDLTLMLTSIP